MKSSWSNGNADRILVTFAHGVCGVALACATACGDDDSLAVDASVADARTELDAATPDPCRTAATLCGANEIVVDDAWLADRLSDDDLQIVDARDSASYTTGHIPGAVHLDVGALRATVNGIGGQVSSPEVAEELFGDAGLDREAAIVVYGPDVSTTPARLVWTLEHFGHRRVALLDGGFSAWAAGRPVETDPAMASPSLYAVDSLDQDRRVDAQWVLDRLDDNGVVLVDARSDGEFDAGHIPGAVSVDWNRNVANGSLRADPELRALYASIPPTATVVTYCQTGSRASVAYLVLRHLGYEDVRLYDGSWAEWGSRAELPREP